MAENVFGIGEVLAHELEIKDNSTPEASFYTIEKGDTLWGIASNYLGYGAKYPEMFDANK